MNINDFLENSEAVDFGSYYIIVCPACGHREAYVYKSDIEKHMSNHDFKIPARCNRQNNCGVVTLIDETIFATDKDIAVLKEKQKKLEKAKKVTSAGHSWITNLIEHASLLSDYTMDIRGIKNSTLKKYKICYLSRGWNATIKNREDEFGKFLFKPPYAERDLIFPVYNLDGRLDRIYLRCLDKQLEKKEIQIKFFPESLEGFNLLSLKEDKIETIIFTEGIYDALSVIEAVNRPEVEAIGIPGVKKWARILKILNETPEAKSKKYVIAFDNDEAGEKNANSFLEELKKEGYKASKYKIFKYKDLNEFYQAEPKLLGNALRKYVKDK